MLPKHLRDKKQEAKKILFHAKRIIKRMEGYLETSNPKAINTASAFFQIFKHHIECGDLSPEDVHLAALLRHKEDDDEHGARSDSTS